MKWNFILRRRDVLLHTLTRTFRDLQKLLRVLKMSFREEFQRRVIREEAYRAREKRRET